MSVRAAFVVSAAIATAVLVACSSFDGSDTPVSTDGGIESSSDVPDAASPNEVDAAPPDLFDDGFESDASTAPCKDWLTHGMDAVEADMFHTGSRACRVCVTDATDPFLSRDFPIEDPARTYTFEVQMRLSNEGLPDAGIDAGADADADADVVEKPTLVATLGTYLDTDTQTNFHAATTPPTSEWTRVVVSLEPKAGGPAVTFARMSVYTTPKWNTRCFDIDDVRLYAR